MEKKLTSRDIAHLRNIHEQIEKGGNVNDLDLKFWNENNSKYFEHLQNEKLGQEEENSRVYEDWEYKQMEIPGIINSLPEENEIYESSPLAEGNPSPKREYVVPPVVEKPYTSKNLEKLKKKVGERLEKKAKENSKDEKIPPVITFGKPKAGEKYKIPPVVSDITKYSSEESEKPPVINWGERYNSRKSENLENRVNSNWNKFKKKLKTVGLIGLASLVAYGVLKSNCEQDSSDNPIVYSSSDTVQVDGAEGIVLNNPLDCSDQNSETSFAAFNPDNCPIEMGAEDSERIQEVYTVEQGDNIWNIAKLYLPEDASPTDIWYFGKDIAEESGIENWNVINPGQELIIPGMYTLAEESVDETPVGEVDASQTEEVTATETLANQYQTIAVNDRNLTEIARDLCGPNATSHEINAKIIEIQGLNNLTPDENNDYFVWGSRSGYDGLVDIFNNDSLIVNTGETGEIEYPERYLNSQDTSDYGRIIIGPEPYAENVNIEGVDYGSTPMSGVGIAPGEYEVTFERSEEKLDEYFPENITQNITVISGQTTAIRYDEGGEIAPVMELNSVVTPSETYQEEDSVIDDVVTPMAELESIVNGQTYDNVTIPTNINLNGNYEGNIEIAGSASGGSSGGLGEVLQIEGVSVENSGLVHTEAQVEFSSAAEYSINGIINESVSVTIPVMGEYTVYITDGNGNTVGVYETNRIVGRDMPYNFAIENFELYEMPISELEDGVYNVHLGNALTFDPVSRQYTADEITAPLEFIVGNSDSTYVEEEKVEEEKGLNHKELYDKIIDGYNSNKRFSTIKKEISNEYKGIGDKTLVSTIDADVRNDGDAYSERFDRDYAKVSGLMDDVIKMYENSVSYAGIKEHCKIHGMGISDSTIYRVGNGKYDSFLA